jgi:hypothetical protein
LVIVVINSTDLLLLFHFHISVMGSLEQSLPILSVSGSVEANGGSFSGVATHASDGVPGGGSGGTILLFVRTLSLEKNSVLSSVGGVGSNGSGGGGGGRIHFHWSDIPTGDDYVPFATVKGSILTRCVLKSDAFSVCLFPFVLSASCSVSSRLS